jgi:hypothetical protein
LKYFIAIRYNLWPFGAEGGNLLYFLPIWYIWIKKNLATLPVLPFSNQKSEFG